MENSSDQRHLLVCLNEPGKNMEITKAVSMEVQAIENATGGEFLLPDLNEISLEAQTTENVTKPEFLVPDLKEITDDTLPQDGKMVLLANVNETADDTPPQDWMMEMGGELSCESTIVEDLIKDSKGSVEEEAISNSSRETLKLSSSVSLTQRTERSMMEAGKGKDAEVSTLMVGSCNNPKLKNASQKSHMVTREYQELLPGINDYPTLFGISTKISYAAIHTLLSVSHGWRQAILSGEVNNARVRSSSTDSLIVVEKRSPKDVNALALYSLTDESFYPLPPNPYILRGTPWVTKSFSLDGKIYVLAGARESNGFIIDSTIGFASLNFYELDFEGEQLPIFINTLKTDSTKELKHSNRNMCMLDLAGQRQWKLCARMRKERVSFACAVLQGKIYVVGGLSPDSQEPVSHAEVYDPITDAWSYIKPMVHGRFLHQVFGVGEQLFAYDGNHQQPWEIYDSIKNEWRVIHRHRVNLMEEVEDKLFVADGNFYILHKSIILVYDTKEDYWIIQHFCSWGELEVEFGLSRVVVESIIYLNKELLAKVRIREERPSCLLQSRGFGKDNLELVWKRAPNSWSHTDLTFSMSSVEI